MAVLDEGNMMLFLNFDDKQIPENLFPGFQRQVNLAGYSIHERWSAMDSKTTIASPSDFDEALSFCRHLKGSGIAFIDYSLRVTLPDDLLLTEQEALIAKSLLESTNKISSHTTPPSTIASFNDKKQGLILVAALTTNVDAHFDIVLATSSGTASTPAHAKLLDRIRPELWHGAFGSLSNVGDIDLGDQFDLLKEEADAFRAVDPSFVKKWWPGEMAEQFKHDTPIPHNAPATFPGELETHLVNIGAGEASCLKSLYQHSPEMIWAVFKHTWGYYAKVHQHKLAGKNPNPGKDLLLGIALLALYSEVKASNVECSTEGNISCITNVVCSDGESSRRLVHHLCCLFKYLSEDDVTRRHNQFKVGVEQSGIRVCVSIPFTTTTKKNGIALEQWYRDYLSTNGVGVSPGGEVCQELAKIISALHSKLELKLYATMVNDEEWTSFQFGARP